MAITAQPTLRNQDNRDCFRCPSGRPDLLILSVPPFHQNVHFGVLVAGYAMGILFWIVSITPQGIGVVEGMMTLVFASLGVPIEHATVIALAFPRFDFLAPTGDWVYQACDG